MTALQFRAANRALAKRAQRRENRPRTVLMLDLQDGTLGGTTVAVRAQSWVDQWLDDAQIKSGVEGKPYRRNVDDALKAIDEVDLIAQVRGRNLKLLQVGQQYICCAQDVLRMIV